MDNRLVKSWMTSPVVTVDPGTLVSEARMMMAEKKIRALPVVKDGTLVGIVTRRGLLRLDLSILGNEPWHTSSDLDKETVGEIMTLKPLTILPSAFVPKAARIMLENKITALPVVEDGRILGMLTNSDIFRFLIAGYSDLKKPVLIRNYMNDEVVTIEKDTSLLEAHRLMGTKRIRSLPVLEEGHLIGIVTRTDLMSNDPSRLTSRNQQELSLKILTQDVEKVMSAPVYTITQDEEISAAARIMLERKIHVLPVLDEEKKLCGIITESDLFLMVVQKLY